MSGDTDTVTGNGSGQQGVSVSRNGCGVCADGYQPPQFNTKELALRGLHCTGCHDGGHLACVQCGGCMPDGHRYDRRYCSSTCRVDAHRDREQTRRERQAWEAANPEKAAQQAAEREATREEWRKEDRAIRQIMGVGDEAKARRRRREEARQTAGRCVDCQTPLDDGQTIHRRHRSGMQSLVLPYCAGCACRQPDGYHNRDAEDGYYYPACACPGDSDGRRAWHDPQPCAGCGRPVRYHRQAHPGRFVRWWVPPAEADRADVDVVVVRTFCSQRCRRRVLQTVRKAKRQARQADVRPCADCGQPFSGRRSDARYCSNACRQAAWRARQKRDRRGGE